eukprot:jgi/Hompol1/4320/HPOL_001574-RA
MHTRISRKAHSKNMLKISYLKTKLGDKYRIIGRDKRQSPLTERRSPSKPSQPQPPVPKPVHIAPFLASKANPRPLDVTPGRLLDALKTAKTLAATDAATASIKAAEALETKASTGIRMRSTKTDVRGPQNDQNTIMRLPEGAVPKIPDAVIASTKIQAFAEITRSIKHGSKQSVDASGNVAAEADAGAGAGAGAGAKSETDESPNTVTHSEAIPLSANALPTIEPKTAVGPFYQFGITPSEAETILSITPKILTRNNQINIDASFKGDKAARAEEQAEMLRRIICLENSNEMGIRKFNIARSVEIFQRKAGDTGSPEVQAAVFTVRIHAMQKHLTLNPKDKSTKRRLQTWLSKRDKILKYLRRKDLAKFVETCRAIGVDPKVIHCYFDEYSDCQYGACIIGAITKYTSQLGCDSSATTYQKTQALKFLINLIADIAQPLHITDDSSRSTVINFNGYRTTLHDVWENTLPDARIGNSYSNDYTLYGEALINPKLLLNDHDHNHETNYYNDCCQDHGSKLHYHYQDHHHHHHHYYHYHD